MVLVRTVCLPQYFLSCLHPFSNFGIISSREYFLFSVPLLFYNTVPTRKTIKVWILYRRLSGSLWLPHCWRTGVTTVVLWLIGESYCGTDELASQQIPSDRLLWYIHQTLSLLIDILSMSIRGSLLSGRPLIARFMEPTWGTSGANRTQEGPLLAPWTLLSGVIHRAFRSVNGIYMLMSWARQWPYINRYGTNQCKANRCGVTCATSIWLYVWYRETSVQTNATLIK